MVYLFLANGFEEIEALAPLDLLRRAGVEVTTVGVGGEMIRGSHGIVVQADMPDTMYMDANPEMIILPGGMPGTLNLDASPTVKKALGAALAADAYIAAICAAPMALSQAGLLKGKTFTMYPGMTSFLADGDMPQTAGVVSDGNIITGKGPGLFFDFACAIAEKLGNSTQVAALKKAMFWGEK